jgi:fumarylacetoacetase
MSWLTIPRDCDFTLSNIPFGVFKHVSSASPQFPSIAIAIGSHILDLNVFSQNSGFSALPEITPHVHVFQNHSLNAFAALGKSFHVQVRAYLQEIFAIGGRFPEVLQNNVELRNKAMFLQDCIEMLLPMEIGDYTDFYAGRVHAFNVGCLFRGRDNALQKNYEQIPVGYHGRASSVVVSGTPVRRPWGQTAEGVMMQSRRLDLELELAAFVATGNQLGEPVRAQDASENLFGFVIMNDWSGVLIPDGEIP